MQKYFIFILLAFVGGGCKKKSLSVKDISNIPVVRVVPEVPKISSHKEPEVVTEEQPIASVRQEVVRKTAGDSHYHIIVASCTYGERDKAEKLVDGLRKKGYPAQLLETEGRIRVSIENFVSEAEAREQREVYIRDTDRPEIWLLKTP